MMQRVSTDEVMRRALRARICPACPFRPERSETWGPFVTRACEAGCGIFHNLGPLQQIALECRGDPRAAFEHAILERICQKCTFSASAGDYCADRAHRTCPLSVQAGRVLSIIESLLPRLPENHGPPPSH